MNHDGWNVWVNKKKHSKVEVAMQVNRNEIERKGKESNSKYVTNRVKGVRAGCETNTQKLAAEAAENRKDSILYKRHKPTQAPSLIAKV